MRFLRGKLRPVAPNTAHRTQDSELIHSPFGNIRPNGAIVAILTPVPADAND